MGIKRSESSVLDEAVLFVRLGAIGDVVRTLPALDLLARTRPHAAVDWLVEERSASLLVGHPQLREVLIFPRRELARLGGSLHLVAAGALLRAQLARLRSADYHAVVDFQGSFKSAWLASRTRSPRRFGPARGHGREASHLFYTDPVDPGPGRMSRVERNLRFLSLAGLVAPGTQSLAPRAHLPITAADRGWAEGVLGSLAPAARPRVLLYPGTSERQAYKRWPADRYGRVAGRLADAGVQVLVAGGPGEEGMVEAVCAATSAPPARVPLSSLLQLAALLERIDLFVGGDTGPMHLAWAAGPRVLSLFGATDPVINAPYDPDRRGHRVLYHGPEQRPYRVTGAPARAWMEAITVDEVDAACRELLGAGK
jgi:3-deoxy-D-manno-octulosonic-acid transferase/heptosyltransferase-1